MPDLESHLEGILKTFAGITIQEYVNEIEFVTIVFFFFFTYFNAKEHQMYSNIKACFHKFRPICTVHMCESTNILL